jgi:hypothetical protein
MGSEIESGYRVVLRKKEASELFSKLKIPR